MLPTMDQFTAQVDSAVAEQVEWMKAEFGFGNMPLTVKIVDVPTGPHGQARVVYKAKAFAGFQIKIQAYHYLRDELKAYTEYATYNGWPEIGGFETNDWQLAVSALVAHELAHVAQFAFRQAGTRHPFYVFRPEYPNKLFFDGIGQFEGGHGYFFRQIYKRFRKQFVNPHVPASAYTDPKKDFIEGNAFEERMEAKTGEHPLVGIKFSFKGRNLEIVGRNPRNAKLFGYMVKLPDGTFSKCKLSLICVHSPEAKAIIMSTPWLAQEIVDLAEAEKVKKAANARSSMTKRRRAFSARYSSVTGS